MPVCMLLKSELNSIDVSMLLSLSCECNATCNVDMAIVSLCPSVHLTTCSYYVKLAEHVIKIRSPSDTDSPITPFSVT